MIELHTGRYAEAHDAGEQQREYERVVRGVEFGMGLGLKVNAGHGLHYTNVQQIAAIDGIAELNIGHAIVAHAVFVGWENAVREMKAIMVAARSVRAADPPRSSQPSRLAIPSLAQTTHKQLPWRSTASAQTSFR